MNHRIVFIFTSTREEIVEKWKKGEGPDSPLQGLNYLHEADYFVIGAKSWRGILFIPKLLKYDFVIAQDNLLLGYIVSWCARIFQKKTKWLYIAINISTLIRRYKKNPIHLFLLKILWSSYTRIMCISNEQIKDFEKLGIPKKKLIFMPFWIDANFFKNPDSVKEEDVIGSVGRDMGRDYPTLLKVAEKLPYKFCIIAAPKNIPSNIHISSNVSILYDGGLSDVKDLFSRAKIVTIVSKNSDIPEGSDCSGQTVILEALAAGRPTIATRRAWMYDYFVPDEDLIIVEPNNPEAIIQAIQMLWNNDQKRRRLALSGKNKVFTNYTTEAFAKRLLALMNTLT